ncbi:MAG TPA: sortase [Anaerolineales bacterium]|nr:sortase [Anaerolineales bacterium]
MRLILINNWSILLGFTLTVFAISGMVLAVFFPQSMAVDFTPNRAISRLEVPLKAFDLNPVVPEDESTAFESSSAKDNDIDANKDAPVGSPSNQVRFDTKPSKVAASKTDNAVAFIPPPQVPVRIVIPSIDLNAPVVPAPVDFETIAGKEFLQWFVPDEFAVGWHTTSAMLGETGNTVLNGHHNVFGEVFGSLVDVTEGDMIWVESDHYRYSYQITNKMILPEKYEQLDVRMNNAQWILPTIDERLTLISCWPYESNTHRLIIVAIPLGQEEITPNFK